MDTHIHRPKFRVLPYSRRSEIAIRAGGPEMGRRNAPKLQEKQMPRSHRLVWLDPTGRSRMVGRTVESMRRAAAPPKSTEARRREDTMRARKNWLGRVWSMGRITPPIRTSSWHLVMMAQVTNAPSRRKEVSLIMRDMTNKEASQGVSLGKMWYTMARRGTMRAVVNRGWISIRFMTITTNTITTHLCQASSRYCRHSIGRMTRAMT
mmetsp:Transcript_44331/g.101241  ORF Transcript_44331/g.101241 Transcript_44331/m.101241 type:complete len:207 (+) Transcript_44331:1383-2003(+)